MAEYKFEILSDTALGRLNVRALDYEIRRSDPAITSAALVYVSQDGSNEITVSYESELSQNDQSTLRSIISSHRGEAVSKLIAIQTAHVANQKTIASPSWDNVGGVVTRPEVFGPLGVLTFRLSMAAQVPNGGIKIRLVESDSGGNDNEMGVFDLNATGNDYNFHELDFTGATPGTHEYLVQAKLNSGGRNGEIRSASITLSRTEVI